MYVAGSQITVDGELRQPGDPVPEAATWPNLRSYLSCGQIRHANIEELAAEVERLGEQLAVASAAPERVAELETKNAELEAAHLADCERYDLMVAELATANASVAALTTTLESADASLAQATADVSAKDAEIAGLKAKVAELEAALVEAAKTTKRK